MRDRHLLGPLPGSRRIGLVVPVLLSMVDSFVIWFIVAEGGPCDPECASVLSVLPAPVIGPLLAVGVGDAERQPGMGVTALAGLVVTVTVLLWWWFVTNRLAERAKGSMLRFFGLYLIVVIVICAKNAAFLAIADGNLLWPAFVAEVILAGFFLWRWARPA